MGVIVCSAVIQRCSPVQLTPSCGRGQTSVSTRVTPSPRHPWRYLPPPRCPKAHLPNGPRFARCSMSEVEALRRLVLVIDDNKEARVLADRVLRRLGEQAVCVASGAEAMEFLQHE